MIAKNRVVLFPLPRLHQSDFRATKLAEHSPTFSYFENEVSSSKVTSSLRQTYTKSQKSKRYSE